MLYNICIDLSWQILWLRFEDENSELINNKKYYDKVLNNCNFITLQYRLTLAREYKIRDYVKDTFENESWFEFRRKYNYYKHKGTFHIEGLGDNSDKLLMAINGTVPKRLSREEFNLDEWRNRLIDFNIQFNTYFDNIIRLVLPYNYGEPMGLEDIIKYCNKSKELEEATNE